MIEIITDAKKEGFNEDKFIVKENCWIVIDGATGLYESKYLPNDTIYFVEKLKSFLEKNLNFNTTKEKLIELLFLFLNKNRINASASLIAAIKNNNTIDFIRFGDCEAFTIEEKVFGKNKIEDFDKIAIDVIKKIMKENKEFSYSEARNKIKDLLIKNREETKKISFSSENKNHIFDTKTTKIQDFVLASDGFYSYHKSSDFFTKPLNKILEEVRVLEVSNIEKLKNSDDATAIKVTFK